MHKILAKLAAGAIGCCTALTLSATPVEAKQICGWYAVVYCSKSETLATKVLEKGFGRLFVTSAFKGMPPNRFCIASGPQSRSGAQRDRKAALKQGISKSVTVYRACADETVFNDD